MNNIRYHVQAVECAAIAQAGGFPRLSDQWRRIAGQLLKRAIAKQHPQK